MARVRYLKLSAEPKKVFTRKIPLGLFTNYVDKNLQIIDQLPPFIEFFYGVHAGKKLQILIRGHFYIT